MATTVKENLPIGLPISGPHLAPAQTLTVIFFLVSSSPAHEPVLHTGRNCSGSTPIEHT